MGEEKGKGSGKEQWQRLPQTKCPKLNWLAHYQFPSSVRQVAQCKEAAVPKFALIKLSLGRANRKQFVFGGT